MRGGGGNQGIADFAWSIVRRGLAGSIHFGPLEGVLLLVASEYSAEKRWEGIS